MILGYRTIQNINITAFRAVSAVCKLFGSTRKSPHFSVNYSSIAAFRRYWHVSFFSTGNWLWFVSKIPVRFFRYWNVTESLEKANPKDFILQPHPSAKHLGVTINPGRALIRAHSIRFRQLEYVLLPYVFSCVFLEVKSVKLFAILIYHIFGFTSAASDKHYIKIRSGNTCHTWDLSGLHCASLAQPVWKIAGNTSERSTLLFWQTTYICYCLFRTLSILNCLAPSPFPV